jgi:hypothetical protein
MRMQSIIMMRRLDVSPMASNYRQRETKTLNRELQIKEIVEINHRHLVTGKELSVNFKFWEK